MSNPPDPTDLLALALAAAEQAGTLLVEGLRRNRELIGHKSSSTDMVTEMDHASERLIVETIRGRRPDDGFLGEEGTDEAGSSGVRWVIDPLDGTTNYLYGHVGFGVSVAAEHEGEVLAGVVLDPLRAEVFAATRGGGATRNGLPIGVSSQTDAADSLVATGFSYAPERRRRQALVLVEVLPRIRDVRRMGAAAVDLCSVACGRVDAFYERGLAPWDHAAGALIAHEAGATVGDLEGRPASSSFVLAAPAALFPSLASILVAAGAGEA